MLCAIRREGQKILFGLARVDIEKETPIKSNHNFWKGR